MNFLKYFFIFLSMWISAAIYWAYYLSNISNLKVDTKTLEAEIIKEEQLFAKYNIKEDLEISSWDNKLETGQDKYEIFEKEVPELKIIRTSFSKENFLNPTKKIIISFWKEINIYSLLWFKKVINWKYFCEWEEIKSEKKTERCNSENKLFITKKWEKESIFKWVIKKSEIDKKTISINTKIEELQNYELKIIKWLKSFKKNEEWSLYELKEEININFQTTDKEGNKKEESGKIESNQLETNTDKIEVSSWSIKEDTSTENLSEKNEMSDEEYQEWIKNKKDEIWEQDVENLKKAESQSEPELEADVKTEKKLETDTKIEKNQSSTGSQL